MHASAHPDADAHASTVAGEGFAAAPLPAELALVLGGRGGRAAPVTIGGRGRMGKEGGVKGSQGIGRWIHVPIEAC